MSSNRSAPSNLSRNLDFATRVWYTADLSGLVVDWVKTGYAHWETDACSDLAGP